MDEAVLKKVCKFLKKQKDNEAVFQTFWEGTKEFYPSDLSKNKVKAWLKEHPERFEIIKSETGNPFGKIKLKVEASNYVLPTTTKAEDIEIAQKLIESIDSKGENGHLFAIICKNKAQIFPEKLRDKKHIRTWLTEHEKWFREVKDATGGLYSVEVLGKARHLKKCGPAPLPPETSEKKARRGKTTPQKAKDDTDSVDLLKMAGDITLRVSGKLKNEGGTIPFESLFKAKDVIYPLSEEEALISFLAAFPLKFEIIDIEGLGKWVHLKGTNDASAVANDASANDAISKVTSFIFQSGGTVPFANLVEQTGTLIGKTVNGPHVLSAWLNANANIFEVVPKPDNPSKPGQVKVKFAVFPRFCQHYVTHGHCPMKKCQFLHICKAFVCQRPHSNEDCKLSHYIRDAHNKVIVDKMGALSRETDAVVVNVLLKSCFPRVCLEHNKNGVCLRGDKCHFLHVCGDYVLNQCGNPLCSLGHNVVDGLHNIDLLKKYALLPSPKLSVEIVKANIAHAQVTKPQWSGLQLESRRWGGQGVEVGIARFQHFPAADLKFGKSKAGHTAKVEATNLQPHQNVQGHEKKKRRRPRRRRNKSGQASSSIDAGSSEETDSSAGDLDNASDSSSSHNAIPSLLSLENIQKSNLAASLAGKQKVEYWMRSPTQVASQQEAESGFGNPAKVPDPRKRSDSTSSSEISHVSNQSSVSSSQSSVWQDDLQKKVFITILEKYNGNASFNKISKDKELFGHDIDVVKWFENHRQNFILHRNGQGKIDTVSAFSRRSRICLNYSRKQGCINLSCSYLHICRNHIEGHCQAKACRLNHNANSDTVTQAAKHIGLQDLTPEQLLTLIRVSVPAVCHFHNQGCCNRGDFCPNLHVCKNFVHAKGHQWCKARACKFGHEQALLQGPATRILKMYQLYGKQPNFKYIQKMIFVLDKERKRSSGPQQIGGERREVQGERKASDEPRSLMNIDLTQKVDSPAQEIEEVTPNICPQFLMHQCRKKKCSRVHFSLPYCWQFKLSSSPGSWCSFDNTDCENIEKYFCDVYCTAAELNISTNITGDASSVRLDFQSMSGHPQPSADQSFKIRRLECRQKDGSEAWYKTPWMWYELESSRWIAYETNKASVFEELFLKGNLPIDWSTYRRRPAAFLTKSEVDEKKRRTQEQQTPELNTPPTPTSPISSQPPQPTSDPVREITPPQPSNCHRTRVEPGSPEYKLIEKLLGSSTAQDALVINQIERIVSDALWVKYKSKKKSMTDELQIGENLNDRRLFIPCLYEDIERIMTGNVHDSSISRILPKPFGPGYYFTSNASLCIQWCREHLTDSRVFLIVCQVLLGTSTQGSRGLKEFPRLPDGRFYDSLVDNKDDSSVFVIKNVDQCYPAFVIDISYTDFEIVEDNHGLTAAPQHNYPQIPPATYVPPNHPLSPSYVPQSPNISPVVLQQQPLFPNTPPGPPDFVKVPPLYSERSPATVPPPEYTPYPQPTHTPASAVPPRPNVRQMSASRSSGEPRNKKDCLVM